MNGQFSVGHASFRPHLREVPFSELSPVVQARLLKPKRVVKRKRAKRRKHL